ncbi:hypothetical protein BDN72DRAFT_299220 [Pluteus cervinus]|uniref:Uncharacterized protein n=1 Tax=Pluteus cervinus TaxID=181527 RepID=A0ACD3ADY3_9AGAR|nr:hypothetical protein BDN72DRAFT_299220 [Pluteus cervinus]
MGIDEMRAKRGGATDLVDEIRRSVIATLPLCEGCEVREPFDSSVDVVTLLTEATKVPHHKERKPGWIHIYSASSRIDINVFEYIFLLITSLLILPHQLGCSILGEL